MTLTNINVMIMIHNNTDTKVLKISNELLILV